MNVMPTLRFSTAISCLRLSTTRCRRTCSTTSPMSIASPLFSAASVSRRNPMATSLTLLGSVVRPGPESRCLRCDGQYTTSAVMMERDGYLDDPSYVAQGPVGPGNENMFPFSATLGSLMLLEMLRVVLREPWWPPVPTKLHSSYVSARMMSQTSECDPSCSVAARTGVAVVDRAKPSPSTGRPAGRRRCAQGRCSWPRR